MIIHLKIILVIVSMLLAVPVYSQTVDKTGELELMFSIPFVNSFYSQPEGEPRKYGTGFLGISGAIGYRYAQHRFVSIIASSQIQYEIPVPMGIDYESGIYEDQYSSNISLIKNSECKRFVFGYGLSYSWYTWRIRYFGQDYIPPDQVGKIVSNRSIGLNLSTYYRIGKHVNVGIVYRPDFLMIKPFVKMKYQHSISLDFCWRWRINPSKKH